MADKWARKLSFPKIGKSREADVAAHQSNGHGSSESVGTAGPTGLAASESWPQRDPGLDAADVLSSCEGIPSAMLPSIQESGPSVADEISEGDRDHIVEVSETPTAVLGL
jgi:hypothetical protein